MNMAEHDTERASEFWGADTLFRSLAEATDDLVTIVDTEGRFLYVNGAAGRIFGLAPEQCVGRYAFDFVHTDDRESTRAAFVAWVRSDPEQSMDFENRQVHADGSMRQVLWKITRQEVEGHGRMLVSYARGVTEAREVSRLLEEQALGDAGRGRRHRPLRDRAGHQRLGPRPLRLDAGGAGRSERECAHA